MKNNTKRLVQTAILIAIATVLSVITVFRLPFGGSITPLSMLPVILISFIYGVKWGLFSALVYGILQMVVGMDVVAALFMPGESQMVVWKAVSVCLLDYLLAYTMLGLGGAFKGKLKNRYIEIALGSALSIVLCYAAHILSGYVFYGAWAEWFFTQENFYSFGSVVMQKFSGNALALLYSVVYNGLYMVPELVMTIVFAPVVYKVLEKSKVIGQ